MRILILAAALTLVAQPAFAHHKPNHPSFGSRAEHGASAPEACATPRHRHKEMGDQDSLARRCRELREALRAAPNDAALRARCDRAARSLSERPCAE